MLAGRNIHALDPYRMPSPAALQRGTEVAASILSSHCEANSGAWPETIAVRFPYHPLHLSFPPKLLAAALF